jgi:hypothetical protein
MDPVCTLCMVYDTLSSFLDQALEGVLSIRVQSDCVFVPELPGRDDVTGVFLLDDVQGLRFSCFVL